MLHPRPARLGAGAVRLRQRPCPHGAPTGTLVAACAYLEALASSDLQRFSENCASLLGPVAAVVMRPPPTEDAEEVADAEWVGVSREGSVPVEAVSKLRPWVELLKVCLVPFCSLPPGAGKRDGRSEAGALQGHGSDSEDEDGDGDGQESTNQEARSAWLTAWAERTAVRDPAGTLRFPLPWQEGGLEEDAPAGLAASISRLTEVSSTAGCLCTGLVPGCDRRARRRGLERVLRS